MAGRKGKKEGEISATVGETNKMRKELGMKPLDVEQKPDPAQKKQEDGPSEAEIKKRVAAAKSKREHGELTAGKGLGEIILDEEGSASASDWIAKTRKADGSMKAVGSAAGAAGKRGNEAKEVPKGTRVRHDLKNLQDGETTVMTLSDRSILNDNGEIDNTADELSNVRMLDGERAKFNEEIRNQVDYDPDKDGAEILEKYNEPKTGPKGFVLGGVAGVIDESDPEKRLAILTKMSEAQSLETKQKLQSDFYTSEEMKKFRKAPKKVKQKKRKLQDTKDPENQLPTMAPGSDVLMPGRPVDAGSDEEDPELYEQLSKQRRLVRRAEAGAVKKGEAALESVSDRIQTMETMDKPEEDAPVVRGAAKDAEDINITPTTEFCNVVQTPLEKMETLKHESFRGSTLWKQQAAARRAKATKTGAGKYGLDEDVSTAGTGQETEAPLQEDDLDLSAASGLAYLRARDAIGCDQETHKNKKTDNRPLEMSTVDGDIKLEYRDDFGRVQTPKEAFRSISWKFHGKNPGRKNMERRLLRLETEMRLKTMNVMEQLPTLRALKHMQKSDAKPYMVLSGANEK